MWTCTTSKHYKTVRMAESGDTKGSTSSNEREEFQRERVQLYYFWLVETSNRSETRTSLISIIVSPTHNREKNMTNTHNLTTAEFHTFLLTVGVNFNKVKKKGMVVNFYTCDTPDGKHTQLPGHLDSKKGSKPDLMKTLTDEQISEHLYANIRPVFDFATKQDLFGRQYTCNEIGVNGGNILTCLLTPVTNILH